MNFSDCKAAIDPLADREGFSEVDLLIGTDETGQKVVGIRCKFRGQRFEYHLPLTGREAEDSAIFQKVVADFGAPPEVWAMRLSNARVAGDISTRNVLAELERIGLARLH